MQVWRIDFGSLPPDSSSFIPGASSNSDEENSSSDEEEEEEKSQDEDEDEDENENGEEGAELKKERGLGYVNFIIAV